VFLQFGYPVSTDHDEHRGTRLKGTLDGLNKIQPRVDRLDVTEDQMLTEVFAELVS
jgi:hypothetical protein